MKFYDILNGIDCEIFGSDMEITSVEYDSRKVKEGSLFIAISGFQTDGHLYIQKAIENGAAAVLCEKCDMVPKGISYAVSKDTRTAMAIAGSNFYGGSAKRLKMIGITGTNGKTTITYLVKKILELVGIKTGLIGTNQNMIGDEVLETGRTTPESLDLHKLLAEMEDKGATHVIMEVSSHALELKRVAGIEFEVGAFTNLTRDHLDFHKTFENYCDAKSILFRNSKKGCVNFDDEWTSRLMKEATCETIYYGTGEGAQLRAEDIRLSQRGVIFGVNYGGKVHEVRLSIPGMFSVYNALCAISICLSLGISFDDIIKGLILAKGVKGRCEVINILADYTVIIDYAHTPDGLENIIKTVRGFAKGRVLTVFGCGGDRDKTKRPIMGEVAERLSDITIVTSDNPRSEDPELIISDILEGMEKKEGTFKAIVNRTEAIRYAMEIAEKDDVIILAGKGHETYQILKDETIHYDEREIVKDIFNS